MDLKGLALLYENRIGEGKIDVPLKASNPIELKGRTVVVLSGQAFQTIISLKGNGSIVSILLGKPYTNILLNGERSEALYNSIRCSNTKLRVSNTSTQISYT